MNKLLPIPCLLIIASCSKEINEDQLVKREGIYYEINSQTPFSGRVVAYHKNGQLEGKVIFKDGKRNGFMEYYSENGELHGKYCYKNDEIVATSYCEK